MISGVCTPRLPVQVVSQKQYGKLLLPNFLAKCNTDPCCVVCGLNLALGDSQGCTALTVPCCCLQGRASDVVVWKANQQYPIAVLHQQHGVTVPAVAIERSPWGQQPQAEALRLVSCSDTGKAKPPLLLPSVPPFPQAAPWHVISSAHLPTLPYFFLFAQTSYILI